MNYYLLENGIITQSADFRFNDDCLETEEEIVRDSLSGQLYLKSEYDVLIATSEYLAEQIMVQKKSQIADLQSQINELDLKRIRAISEPSQKDENTSWLEYYTTQIIALRAEIAAL